jgi:hypothetical protein
MGSYFIADRCAHIDTVGSNVLIRGNMPLIEPNDHYALDEISEASGVDLLSRRLVEIPIIDNVGEREQFEPLLRAFGVDPDAYPTSFWPWWQQPGYEPNAQHGTLLTTEGHELPGALVWRPFEGLPADAAPGPFLGAPGWDFGGFVDKVIELLATCVDTAVYVHCQLGADRTGAFHIGYLMRQYKLDLAAASNLANAATDAGAPNEDYQRLVAAYAAQLASE